jgi:hypothetical protein
MNCPECADAIQRYLDGDEPVPAVAPAWQEHLQTCGRCRRDFAAAQALRQGLRELPRPEVPVTLPARLVELVDRDRRFRGRLGWWRNAWILATAASLLAFVGYNLIPRETPPNPVGPLVDNKQVSPEPKKADAAPRTEDATKAVTALAQSVQENSSAPLSVLLNHANPLERTPKVAQIDAEPLEPAMQAAQSLRSAGRSMAETFEPMANSARQAALFFAREIPVDFQTREN